MGVAVLLHARTILIATRSRLLPLLAVLDSVHASENSVVAGLQPVLCWTLLLLLHDVGRTIATVIC